jgi:hypothetical protein
VGRGARAARAGGGRQGSRRSTSARRRSVAAAEEAIAGRRRSRSRSATCARPARAIRRSARTAEQLEEGGEQRRQPTCDYARLGVVVAGEQYGASFHVCVNRDKCLVHWKESVKAREKSAALRAKGKTKKAAKVEKKAAEKKQESEYERRQREEVAHKAAWEPIAKHVIADAVDRSRPRRR